jgi:hypothetical protein
MTRLDVLCKLHNQDGGTIHQFNSQYKTDWMAFSNFQFKCLIDIHFGEEKASQYHTYFPTMDVSQFAQSLKKEVQNETK